MTGPEKELLQLSVFSELHALFPNVHVHIELVGPAIPQHRSVLHFEMMFCMGFIYIDLLNSNLPHEDKIRVACLCLVSLVESA